MFRLDDNATTQVLPEAWHAYVQALAHPKPDILLEEARARVAACLGVESQNIYFVSGGTEADFLAITTALTGYENVVTSNLEHPAVLKNVESFKHTTWNIKRDGSYDLNNLRIDLQTRLVSIMSASNETGIILPVQKIAEMCSVYEQIIFHTDAVQAVGRLPLDLHHMHMLSFSGHKIGAVGGIGVLYSQLPIETSYHNVAGAVSLATALEHAVQLKDVERLTHLRNYFEQQLCAALGAIEIIAANVPRLCNTSCIRFIGCEGEALMMALDINNIAVSTGSACSSGAIEPSPVLLNMGFTPQEAKEAVRFSFSKNVTREEIDKTLEICVDIVKRLRINSQK